MHDSKMGMDIFTQLKLKNCPFLSLSQIGDHATENDQGGQKGKEMFITGSSLRLKESRVFTLKPGNTDLLKSLSPAGNHAWLPIQC